MCNSCRIALAYVEENVAKLLRGCVERSGHLVVFETQSAEELTRSYRIALPDLIIADVEAAADIEGQDVVEELIWRRPTPTIVLTTQTDEEFINRARKCHVLACLIKPVRERDLNATLSIALNRFDELREHRDVVSHLRQALKDRKAIDRAKGLIMKQLSLDEPSAFRRMRTLARNQRKTVAEVAQSILLVSKALESGDEC
jgi:response regulator NasT